VQSGELLVRGATCKELKEVPKELWSNCFLALRRWIGIVEGFKETSDGQEQLGPASKVNGTLLGVTPEHRSQIA
jgi:hypothetical protein